jgi:hypothetical protein
MTAGRQLVSLLREYEHRVLPGADNTPRGVAESLKGDRHHPEVLDDTESSRVWPISLGCSI